MANAVRIGYHASHEQFRPSELLELTRRAEQAGFAAAKSSDHFAPWSERQGQSGFAWSWLGAALQATRFPIGSITAPGWRYHPAIVAQAGATLAEMFPGRFWLALGSGQAMNEHITGLAWPDKAERNARLRECAEIIRALWRGETVTHRGRVSVVEARLYTRPDRLPPLYGAALTEATASFVASWADGLLTVGSQPKTLRGVVEAFRRGGGERKRMLLQVGLCWAPREEDALAMAHDQWRANAIGGEVNWDLRRPSDFDLATRFVRPDDMREIVLISSDLGWFRDRLSALADLGFAEMYLHNVGTNQAAFVDAFGAHVLPAFR